MQHNSVEQTDINTIKKKKEFSLSRNILSTEGYQEALAARLAPCLFYITSLAQSALHVP